MPVELFDFTGLALGLAVLIWDCALVLELVLLLWKSTGLWTSRRTLWVFVFGCILFILGALLMISGNGAIFSGAPSILIGMPWEPIAGGLVLPHLDVGETNGTDSEFFSNWDIAVLLGCGALNLAVAWFTYRACIKRVLQSETARI